MCATAYLYLHIDGMNQSPLPLSPLSSVDCVSVGCVHMSVSSCMRVHDGDVSAAPSYVIHVSAAVLV